MNSFKKFGTVLASQGPVRLAVFFVVTLVFATFLSWLVAASLLKASPLLINMASPTSPPSSLSAPTISSPPELSLTPTLPEKVGTPTPVIFYGIVISENLNLRSAPGTQGPVQGTLKLGEIIPLIKREGAWFQTTAGFWVSALFIEVRQTRDEAESFHNELVGKN